MNNSKSILLDVMKKSRAQPFCLYVSCWLSALIICLPSYFPVDLSFLSSCHCHYCNYFCSLFFHLAPKPTTQHLILFICFVFRLVAYCAPHCLRVMTVCLATCSCVCSRPLKSPYILRLIILTLSGICVSLCV